MRQPATDYERCRKICTVAARAHKHQDAVDFYFALDPCLDFRFSFSFVDENCLQFFDAVGWAAGRASGLKKKLSGGGAGVVVCLERGADLHMAQLMPLPLTVSRFNEIQIGFTFLVRLSGSPWYSWKKGR